MGAGIMAVGNAVLPYFSRMAAQQDWASLRRTFYVYVRLIFLVAIPVTALFCLLSEPLVRILFQRGSFSAADTHLVARVQALYALQIPPHIAGILVVRLISSLRANHLLMWASALNLVLNAVLDYLFMKWLGVAGIALSTAVVYLFSFAFCWMALHRILPSGQPEIENASENGNGSL
jgi:putative peptidoglycan lipid II flippase